MLKRSREPGGPPAAGGRERRTANEIHKIQEICPKNRPRKSHFSAHLHAINLSKLTDSSNTMLYIIACKLSSVMNVKSGTIASQSLAAGLSKEDTTLFLK